MCLCFSKKWGEKEETRRERECVWVRERGREAWRGRREKEEEEEEEEGKQKEKRRWKVGGRGRRYCGCWWWCQWLMCDDIRWCDVTLLALVSFNVVDVDVDNVMWWWCVLMMMAMAGAASSTFLSLAVAVAGFLVFVFKQCQVWGCFSDSSTGGEAMDLMQEDFSRPHSALLTKMYPWNTMRIRYFPTALLLLSYYQAMPYYTEICTQVFLFPRFLSKNLMNYPPLKMVIIMNPQLLKQVKLKRSKFQLNPLMMSMRVLLLPLQMP